VVPFQGLVDVDNVEGVSMDVIWIFDALPLDGDIQRTWHFFGRKSIYQSAFHCCRESRSC
jgi:hypothetical protein